MIGIQESARVNNVIVFIKVVDRPPVHRRSGLPLRLDRQLGRHVHPADEHRASSATTAGAGSSAAAGVVFFAYIGFDAVSTTAQEAKNPQRDMPIGIIGSLVDLHDPLRASARS